MTVLFVFVCILMWVSTSEATPADAIDQDELYQLPSGAVVLGSYCTDSKHNLCYQKWHFMGECFMSRNLGFTSAVLTKINCPQSDSTKSTKDSK